MAGMTAGISNRDQSHRLLDRVMAPGHLPFNLAIRIGQLACGPLGRPEDSELVVHHLLDRFTEADLTETLSRIEGTERESVSEGSAAMDLAHRA